MTCGFGPVCLLYFSLDKLSVMNSISEKIQEVTYLLHKMKRDYNLNISMIKTKAMAF